MSFTEGVRLSRYSGKSLARSGRWLAVCLLLCADLHWAEAAEANMKRVISALLSSKPEQWLLEQDFSRYQPELARLYAAGGMRLLWLGADDSEQNVRDALQVLQNAEADGLNPSHYAAESLRQAFEELAARNGSSPQALAMYDLSLSLSLLSFMHDVRQGRVDPAGFNYPPAFGAKTPLDAVRMLKAAMTRQSIAGLPDQAAPELVQYQQLKSALAYYRRQTELEPPADLEFAKVLHPGDSDARMPELRERLRSLGELMETEPAAEPAQAELYDEATVEAVMRLQRLQGMSADGVIGKQTLALLNLKPAEKIGLIKLAMERLRWLPKPPAGRMIMVNIPAFQLWAFNSMDDQTALSMKVVVGKAGETQTPILWEEMRFLEFMPYWNIPKSIWDKEILPKSRTDRHYLTKQEIEWVPAAAPRAASDEAEDDDPQPVSLRVRQRPGKKNPLGKVKFIFPNKSDVYLHDTPARGAFGRDRRDLSHGCVRVAEPEKLAAFVLAEQTGWDKQMISQAMAGPKTQRVTLKKAVPVLFFYNTAYAGQDNKLRFYPDIYGYDQQLQSALDKSGPTVRLGKALAADG